MGDTATQLTHLRAHLAFQSQTSVETAALDWNTSITKLQSRRHITTHLHHKINSKSPSFYTPGSLNSPDGQGHLTLFARRLRNRERLSPADGNLLHWRLRARAIHRHYHTPDIPTLIALMAEGHHRALTPKDHSFPAKAKHQQDRTRFLKRLLKENHINPRRHRRYALTAALTCRRCSYIAAILDLTAPPITHCPHCAHALDNPDPVYIPSQRNQDRPN